MKKIYLVQGLLPTLKQLMLVLWKLLIIRNDLLHWLSDKICIVFVVLQMYLEVTMEPFLPMVRRAVVKLTPWRYVLQYVKCDQKIKKSKQKKNLVVKLKKILNIGQGDLRSEVIVLT